MKIVNDKYYTDSSLAEYLVSRFEEVVGVDNVTEYVEPSAGSGAFLQYLIHKPFLAYDIEPEHEIITKQDFLELDLPYKEGRAFIGNPPFGRVNNLAKKFCNKCFESGDYVGFIMPISQLNNVESIYKFDLIYSEDLGNVKYSERVIRTCFNIYKRPININKFKKIKNSKIIEIQEAIRSKNPKRNRVVKNFDYDIAICAWGRSIGKPILYEGQYAKEFYIKIKNKEFKEQVLEIIKNAKWEEIYPMTAAPSLLQWQVYKYVEEKIKDVIKA